MLIFGCFVGLSVIVLVIAATSLYIERKRLFSLADGAALASCESIALDHVRFDGVRLQVVLDDALVAERVNRYLGASQISPSEASVVSARAPDSKSARVTLATVWRPPIIGELFPVQIPLRVTATARTAYR